MHGFIYQCMKSWVALYLSLSLVEQCYMYVNLTHLSFFKYLYTITLYAQFNMKQSIYKCLKDNNSTNLSVAKMRIHVINTR